MLLRLILPAPGISPGRLPASGHIFCSTPAGCCSLVSGPPGWDVCQRDTWRLVLCIECNEGTRLSHALGGRGGGGAGGTVQPGATPSPPAARKICMVFLGEAIRCQFIFASTVPVQSVPGRNGPTACPRVLLLADLSRSANPITASAMHSVSDTSIGCWTVVEKIVEQTERNRDSSDL